MADQQIYVYDVFDRIKQYILGDVPATSPYNERVLVGSKHLESNIGSPLIVLVPMAGVNFGAPETPGFESNPQLLRTRDMTFDAHCWGKDGKSAEQLADAVTTAVYDATMCRCFIDGEEWTEAGHDVSGVFLVRHFRISGLGILRVDLPATSPITSNGNQEVKLISPTNLSTPTTETDGMGTTATTAVDITP